MLIRLASRDEADGRAKKTPEQLSVTFASTSNHRLGSWEYEDEVQCAVI